MATNEVGSSLEQAIEFLLDQRASSSSICPSEAARAVGGENWRALMDDARAAAERLTLSGAVEVTQGGIPVDLSKGVKGPIRIRRPAQASAD